MADLLQPGRRVQQRRVTNNRDNTLPAKRETALDALTVRSDLRTASRGDGGAAELRKVMDGFMSSGAAAYNAQTQASMPKYRAEAAEGSLDAAADAAPDPARAKSISYQEAFFAVKAEANFHTFSAQTKAAVDEALNNDASPEEVHDIIIAGITDFRDQVIDTIPTASAQRATATRLAAMGAELNGVVNARIKERNKEEFVTAQGGNIAAALAAWPPEVPVAPPEDTVPIEGELPGAEGSPEVNPLDIEVVSRRPPPLPVEAWIDTYRKGGFTPAEAKTQVIQSIMAVALSRDNPRPELLEQLLDSKQADGKTPTFNPAEQNLVLDRISQARNLENQVEREAHEEQRDALLDGWFGRVIEGEIVDDEIVAAGTAGDLTPAEVSQYLGLTQNLRDARGEGHVDEDFVVQQQLAAAQGRNPSDAQVLAWTAAGRFGTGRAALRASIQFLQGNAVARKAGRGGSGEEADGSGTPGSMGMTSKQQRSQNVTVARGYLNGALGRGEGASQYQRALQARAGIEFNRRVAGGESPMTVADSLVEPFSTRIDRGQQARPPTTPPAQTVTRGPDGKLR